MTEYFYIIIKLLSLKEKMCVLLVLATCGNLSYFQKSTFILYSMIMYVKKNQYMDFCDIWYYTVSSEYEIMNLIILITPLTFPLATLSGHFHPLSKKWSLLWCFA